MGIYGTLKWGDRLMVRTRILYIRYWGSIPCLPTPVGVTHRLVSGTIRREVEWYFTCVNKG